MPGKEVGDGDEGGLKEGGAGMDASQCGNDRSGFDMIAVTPKTAIIQCYRVLNIIKLIYILLYNIYIVLSF